MRSFMKIGLALILALSVAVGLASCDSSGGDDGGSSNDLVGIWTTVDASSASEIGIVWVFNASGTGTYTATPLTWQLSGSTLTITAAGTQMSFTLAWLADTKIQITNTSSGEWVILVKT